MTRNPLLMAIATVIGLGLFAVLVVLPRGAQVAVVRSEIDDAETQLTVLEADLASLEAMQDDGSELVRLAELRTSIPASPALPDLLRMLQSAASQAGVTLTSVAPGVPAASAVGSSTVIPISLSAGGSYFDLARFVFELEHLDRLMKVTAVAIQSEGEARALTLTVTAEVYTTDLSAGPGSDPAPGPEVGA